MSSTPEQEDALVTGARREHCTAVAAYELQHRWGTREDRMRPAWMALGMATLLSIRETTEGPDYWLDAVAHWSRLVEMLEDGG